MVLKNLISYKFVSDSIYSLVSFIILALSGITINVIIGNHYGPEGLGIFNQAIALYMIFSLLATLGLNISTLKYVAEHKLENNTLKLIFSSASFLSIFLSSFILIVLLIVSRLIPSILFNEEVTKATVITCLSLPLFSQNKLFMALTNGLRHMKMVSIVQSARWLLIIIQVLLFIHLKYSLYTLCYTFIITEIILFVFFILFYFKYYTFRIKKSGWYKKHLIFGSKSVLTGFLSEANGKIDVFFISFFLSNYYVGIYSFASAIVKGFLSISSVVQMNINPIISGLYVKKEISSIQKYTDKIAAIMMVIMTGTLIVAAIIYPIFIHQIMEGESYIKSIPIFYILLIGIYLPSIYNFCGGYLSMANLLNVALKNLMLIIIFEIISCVIFISLFGFYGAALSTTTTYLFSAIYSNYILQKRMNIRLIHLTPLKDLIRSVLKIRK